MKKKSNTRFNADIAFAAMQVKRMLCGRPHWGARFEKYEKDSLYIIQFDRFGCLNIRRQESLL